MLIGTSIAGIVVPLIAHGAVAAGGWRAAYPALALLPLCIALPLGLLWFREPRPEERPQALAGLSGALAGHTLAEAAREPRFWALLISIAIISMAYGGAHIHMSQRVQLHGFSKAESDATIAVVAIGILAGRLIVGLLFDRMWAPGVAFVSLLLPAAGCYLLMGQSDSLTVVRAGAFLLGFAAGAESDVIAFMAARYFGLANYGKIYGFLYMSFGIGSAISPVLYGSVRDATGNYDPMLIAAMLMFAVGGALLLTLGRYPETRAAEPAAEPQAA
jgi:sugar phosphate permease